MGCPRIFTRINLSSILSTQMRKAVISPSSPLPLQKRENSETRHSQLPTPNLQSSASAALPCEQFSTSSSLSNTVLTPFLTAGVLRLFDVLVDAADFSGVSNRTLFLVTLIGFGVLGVLSTSISLCWCCFWGMNCGFEIDVYLSRGGVLRESWITGESKCACFIAFWCYVSHRKARWR